MKAKLKAHAGKLIVQAVTAGFLIWIEWPLLREAPSFFLWFAAWVFWGRAYEEIAQSWRRWEP